MLKISKFALLAGVATFALGLGLYPGVSSFDSNTAHAQEADKTATTAVTTALAVVAASMVTEAAAAKVAAAAAAVLAAKAEAMAPTAAAA